MRFASAWPLVQKDVCNTMSLCFLQDLCAIVLTNTPSNFVGKGRIRSQVQGCTEVVRYLDDLVSANIAQSRSEAASLLIVEGIKGKAQLFAEIRQHAEEIDVIRKRMQQSVE